MEYLVKRKDDVKVTGQQRRNTVIQADLIFSLAGFLNLMRIAGNDPPQNGVILRDNGTPQIFWIGLLAPLLQIFKPAVPVIETA